MAKVSTEVLQTFTVDDHRAKLDGVNIEVEPDSWGVGDYVLPESLHLNEAHVRWSGCVLGDYGYTCLIHPTSQTTLAAGATAGATQVDVGSVSPYYNPLAGALELELWSADGSTLLESHPIQGLSGNMVQFNGTTLAADRDTSIRVKAVFGAFSPRRGTNRIAGGLQFHANEGVFELRQGYAVTGLLSVGLILSSRVRTVAGGGTRKVTVNFLFRVPTS